jgi:hypothetical protein
VTRALAALALMLAGLQGGSAQSPKPSASAAAENWRITGTVVHQSTGQPLPGIEVEIFPTEAREQKMQYVTGADGRFAFDHLDRGKYSLLASGRGFVNQAYQQHGVYSTAVAVGPDLHSENLIFRLVPDASISGTVTDEENEPVRQGEVFLLVRGIDGSAQVSMQGRTNLDEQGHYHFGHLSAGTYFVAVVAQPWYAQDMPTAPAPVPREDAQTGDAAQAPPEATEPSALDVAYRTTYYSDAVESDNATPIVLHTGERATGDITLRTVPAVRLTLLNLGSDPGQPASAFVQQRLFDTVPVNIPSRSSSTTPGVVNITGVFPGHFFVTARKFTGKDWSSETRELEVASDTEVDTAATSVGPVSVQGSVQLPGNAKLPAGAYIHFINRATGDTFGGTLSAMGTFEAEQSLPAPAPYEISFSNLGDVSVQELNVTGATVTGRTLQLPRSGSVRLKIVLSQGFARIDGTVLRDEKPVSETMVVLVPERLEGNNDLIRRDQSDSDGTFSLYRVLPGRYTVVAIENGWDLDWQNPVVLRPYLAHGQTMEVTAARNYKVSLKAQNSATQASAAPTP